MPTKDQIELILGPLGLTVGMALALLAFATGRVVGKGTADAREAAATKRGDEWKAQSEAQTAINASMAEAIDRNTDVLVKAADIVGTVGAAPAPRRQGGGR